MSDGPAQRDESTSVRRVAAIAGQQWGVIDHRQLRACGIGRSRASRWMTAGRLHRIHPGVYAVGHPTIPPEGALTAALLFAGAGATLSHGTAAWWWRLIDEPPNLIHISADRRRQPVAGIQIHHRRSLSRTRHRRLPVTSVSQALLDYATNAPLRRVKRALAEAEFQDLIDLDEVRLVLGPGRPGSARLRVALEQHQPELALTRSVLEERFLALCVSAGLPPPEVNASLGGLMIDMLWREQRLVVELDGHAAHHTAAQIERDHRRDLILRRAGHEVRRYTWRQLSREAREVRADLNAALARHDG